MPLGAGALSQGQEWQGDGDHRGRDASHEQCNCRPRRAPGQQQPSEQGLQEHGWLQALLARTPSLPAPAVTARVLWLPTLCWR